MKNLFLTILSLLLTMSTGLFGQVKFEAKIQPEMSNLEFMVGSWDNESKFYGPDGKIRGNQKFKQTVEPILEGAIFNSKGYIITPQGDRQVGEGWVFYDVKVKEYVISAVDLQGNFDTFKSQTKKDRWVFINSPKPFQDKEIIWKRIYYDITRDEHKLSMEYSLDGGKTWTLSNVQINKKTR